MGNCVRKARIAEELGASASDWAPDIPGPRKHPHPSVVATRVHKATLRQEGLGFGVWGLGFRV